MTAWCAACSAPLEARRSTRRFCSNACRQRAYRDKAESPAAEAPALVASVTEVAAVPAAEPDPWTGWDEDNEW